MYIFLIIIVCITIVEIYSIVNSGQNYKNKIKSNNVNIITENNDKLNRYSVFRDAKIKHGPGKITIKKDYNIFIDTKNYTCLMIKDRVYEINSPFELDILNVSDENIIYYYKDIS
tara:strand:+ start:876 stop:1220 length:345 start_codon:yes stop_codon:yes gene_type:complete